MTSFSWAFLERYFSRQRHRGGSNDNPTAYQVPFNASTLVQQRSIYRDIKTMNVRADTENVDICAASQPLPMGLVKKLHLVGTSHWGVSIVLDPVQ